MFTHIGNATSISDFSEFADKLVATLPPRKKGAWKPYILLDNHAVHRNKAVTTMHKDRFRILYQPSYSCQFNNVESMFRFVRHNFSKLITKMALRRNYE